MGNQDVGKKGEDLVVERLRERGDVIIERNWRVREGEIDIISCDRAGLFHFVEVKTRSSLAFGHPLEAITQKKAHRLQRLALAWLATHGALGAQFQIDVAAVIIDREGVARYEIRQGVL